MNEMNFYRYAMRVGFCGLIAIWLTMPCAFSQDVSTRGAVENVFVENINDSIRAQVKLKYDPAGLPESYFCHVNTPVCEEGLCKLMIIDVYWDVLGNFLKYELPPHEPLTKFDHLPFTEADHVQLKKILSDRASILRDYPVRDLVDQRVVRKSDVVDAVSAATRAEVKDAIVSGAVYSTYVLWHIVNGPIADRIAAYTKPMFTEKLLDKMFQSGNLHYQYFALHAYPLKDSLKYLPGVIRLVKEGVSYVPYFAIEKIPVSVWTIDKYQVELLAHFANADFELQNAFLNKISGINLSGDAMDLLVRAFGKITDKQLLKVLQIVDYNKTRITPYATRELTDLCGHADSEIAALANSIVKAVKKTGQQVEKNIN